MHKHDGRPERGCEGGENNAVLGSWEREAAMACGVACGVLSNLLCCCILKATFSSSVKRPSRRRSTAIRWPRHTPNSVVEMTLRLAMTRTTVVSVGFSATLKFASRSKASSSVNVLNVNSDLSRWDQNVRPPLQAAWTHNLLD